jgi:hypothetical protein
MNKAEIIKTLRLLAADIANIGDSGVTKQTAAKLLHHDPRLQGGPLVKWFNSEPDERKRKALEDLITATKEAYNRRPDQFHKYAASMPGLIDCVDDEAGEADPWVTVRGADLKRDRSTLNRDASDPNKPWIEKVSRGIYRIRKSMLHSYQS